ncbi:MAG: SCP2 sterol-binding domain-containing protein [Pseudomonadota bacterium]
MTIEELTNFFKAIAPRASALGAVLKFDFGKDGIISIDATQSPAVVTNDDTDADTTVTVTLEDFSDILSKKLPGDLAFSMGKLRVSGDKINGVRLTQFLTR